MWLGPSVEAACRLAYVGMSRAKRRLTITYKADLPTPFAGELVAGAPAAVRRVALDDPAADADAW